MIWDLHCHLTSPGEGTAATEHARRLIEIGAPHGVPPASRPHPHQYASRRKLSQARQANLGVRFDISMLEGVACIARSPIPENRLCYGSYAPVFIPHSAALKVKEFQPDLSAAQVKSLLHSNAESLIAS
ncbi:MAG: hypothetical protein L3J39_00990 [Verrucomicrobiales bacterium]|nr:hypothetical protein [Verrucomicrobiales bacterium]